MEMIKEYWDFMSPHWPAIMFFVVIIVVAQTLKTRLLTKELAIDSELIFWLRRIFPLILLGFGIAMGFIWPGETSPGITETGHKCLYFAGCSAAAIVSFNILKQWIKKKYDVDVGIQELQE
ncbi:MAG TPA: hypothetical protein VMW10_06725 [Alphaproteobacteria bacterium]|nr:hypothetical protein [Alphaproteobacteria bacterium]